MRIFWFFFRQQLAGHVMGRAKRKGVILYLRALRGARLTAVFALLAFFVLQMVVIAGFGALVAGVWLLDVEFETKIQILAATFGALFLIPVVAICFVLSDRFWYRISGAEKMVDDLTGASSEPSARESASAAFHSHPVSN